MVQSLYYSHSGPVLHRVRTYLMKWYCLGTLSAGRTRTTFPDNLAMSSALVNFETFQADREVNLNLC